MLIVHPRAKERLTKCRPIDSDQGVVAIMSRISAVVSQWPGLPTFNGRVSTTILMVFVGSKWQDIGRRQIYL